MGLLGSLFSKEKEYPTLDEKSAVAGRLEPFRAAFDDFASKVSDRIELVAGATTLYAFIGKPPDAFGIVWWRDGKEHNFKTLMKEKNLSQVRVQILSDALRDSYKKHAGDQRYSATLGGKKVVVAPSDAFAADVEKIIHEVN